MEKPAATAGILSRHMCRGFYGRFAPLAFERLSVVLDKRVFESLTATIRFLRFPRRLPVFRWPVAEGG